MFCICEPTTTLIDMTRVEVQPNSEVLTWVISSVIVDCDCPKQTRLWHMAHIDCINCLTEQVFSKNVKNNTKFWHVSIMSQLFTSKQLAFIQICNYNISGFNFQMKLNLLSSFVNKKDTLLLQNTFIIHSLTAELEVLSCVLMVVRK